MVPLVASHFAEIAKFKDFRVEPDLHHYSQLEAAGMLRVYVARFEKKMVGYSVFTVTKHPHFSAIVQANEELLFLAPAYRKGNLGSQLIDFCDEQLASDGVTVIYHTVTVERDFSLLLVRKGYELSDRVYARRLK